MYSFVGSTAKWIGKYGGELVNYTCVLAITKKFSTSDARNRIINNMNFSSIFKSDMNI